MKKLEVRSFRLNNELSKSLKNEAKSQGTSESAIVCEAINQYFQGQKKG